jgi:hypothetical protein
MLDIIADGSHRMIFYSSAKLGVLGKRRVWRE